MEAFYEFVGAAPRLTSAVQKRKDFIHKTIKIDFAPLASKAPGTPVMSTLSRI